MLCATVLTPMSGNHPSAAWIPPSGPRWRIGPGFFAGVPIDAQCLFSSGRGQKQQSRRRRLSANGFAFIPNAIFREGNGAVELAMGEDPNLASPHAS